MNALDWVTVVDRVGIPFAALVGVLFVVYKVGMKAVSAYQEDQKSKREERSQRAGHEKELLGLYSQLSAAIQLLREANEKQNDANERQSVNVVKAIEAMTTQFAEMPKAWVTGLADVYAKAEAGHQNIIMQTGNKIDLAVLDIDKVIADTAAKTQTHITDVERQLTGIPAALAAAMAKEFAPVVAEWKELRSAVEHAVGDGLRDALRPLLDEQQKHLETALERAARSTIETVTTAVGKLADQVAAERLLGPEPGALVPTAEPARTEPEKTEEKTP